MNTAKNKIIYEKDICGFEGKAHSVVFPESINDIKSIVKLSKHDIVPRGTGMSFAGGCAPNNSIVIDMSNMNKILEIDSERKIAYVEAGLLIEDLNFELGKYGLELAVNPLFKTQTIGGAIALNAAGDRELKYGKISNWIHSLEVVNGKGELVEISKTDASDFAGMEGITGVIARAKLRLTTAKTHSLSVLKSDSFDEVLSASNKLKLNHEVSMLVMFDKKLSLVSGLENKYHLIVEYEGDKGRMKGAFYSKFMKMKDNAYFALASKGFTMLENPKFFAPHLKEFISFLDLNSIPYLCNLGSAAVYACFKPDDAGGPEKRKHEEALKKIKKSRARASYNLGIGLTKKDFLDKSEQHLIRRIKLRHDPEWKFQANKVIDFEIKNEELDKDRKKPDNLQELQKQRTPEQEIQALIEEEKAKDIINAKLAAGRKEEIARIAREITEGVYKNEQRRFK